MRHPLHPLFAHFPVALWTTSLASDALGLFTRGAQWWPLGYGCLAAGIAMALPAVATGFYEFLRVPQSHPASRTVVWHLSAMSGAAVFFLGSLLLRKPWAAPQPALGALALSLAGLACLAVGGVLAARLVFGYGVGAK
ncbi:MAG TPA: DUF2231 domain-containing protein [Burkholderiales bacterium]|nr:DUF2231 domain-containing protein [Burkholderiales bacterium]